MATSDTEIANLALAAIGTRSTIASLTEASTEARAVSLHYSRTLEELLRASHWNFARKQTLLTLLHDATQGQTAPTPWLYEYALPSDYLYARYVMPNIEVTPPNPPASAPTAQVNQPNYIGPPIQFLISSSLNDSDQQITTLLTNQPSAILVYTCRVTNPNLYDSMFLTAFSHLLASRICVQLTGDKQMARSEFQIADDLVRAARARDGSEGLVVIDSIPDWMRVRGYASDWAYPGGSMFVGYPPQNLTPIS